MSALETPLQGNNKKNSFILRPTTHSDVYTLDPAPLCAGVVLCLKKKQKKTPSNLGELTLCALPSLILLLLDFDRFVC